MCAAPASRSSHGVAAVTLSGLWLLGLSLIACDEPPARYPSWSLDTRYPVAPGLSSERADGSLDADPGDVHPDACTQDPCLPDPSSRYCPPGQQCHWTCLEPCAALCAESSHCQLECPTGACTLACQDQAQCHLNCPLGTCDTLCAPGARCSVACRDGDCHMLCSQARLCAMEDCAHSCTVACGGTIHCRNACLFEALNCWLRYD